MLQLGVLLQIFQLLLTISGGREDAREHRVRLITKEGLPQKQVEERVQLWFEFLCS